MDDELSQRDLIRHPEFKEIGEWRIRRLMARIRDAAVKFAELQGDEQILAAINRLTRAEEWCGGRGWPRRRGREESHKTEEARGGDSTRPWQESRPTFLQLDFRDLEDVARDQRHAGRGEQRRAGRVGR